MGSNFPSDQVLAQWYTFLIFCRLVSIMNNYYKICSLRLDQFKDAIAQRPISSKKGLSPAHTGLIATTALSNSVLRSLTNRLLVKILFIPGGQLN